MSLTKSEPSFCSPSDESVIILYDSHDSVKDVDDEESIKSFSADDEKSSSTVSKEPKILKDLTNEECVNNMIKALTITPVSKKKINKCDFGTSPGLPVMKTVLQSSATRTPKPTVMADASTSITPYRFDEKNFFKLPESDPSDCYERLLEETKVALNTQSGLRPIVIDGSNVAMEHGKQCFNSQRVFSCRGILKVVDFFIKRGHKEVKAVVPHCRLRNIQHDGKVITDGYLLDEMRKKNNIIFTPASVINGRVIVSYDDNFIIKLAAVTGGVIVSNDRYRDILKETRDDSWRDAILQRTLQFVFANDVLMIASDPMGRDGPSLDKFLSLPADEVKSKRDIKTSSEVAAVETKNTTAESSAKSNPKNSSKIKAQNFQSVSSNTKDIAAKSSEKKTSSSTTNAMKQSSVKPSLQYLKRHSRLPSENLCRNRSMVGLSQRHHTRSDMYHPYHRPTTSAWCRPSSVTSELDMRLCYMFPSHTFIINKLLMQFPNQNDIHFFMNKIEDYIYQHF